MCVENDTSIIIITTIAAMAVCCFAWLQRERRYANDIQRRYIELMSRIFDTVWEHYSTQCGKPQESSDKESDLSEDSGLRDDGCHPEDGRLLDEQSDDSGHPEDVCPS